MAEAYVGEIRIFAGNFNPHDWAICDGELINIQDNEELYSLLGTTYGGDGRNTFALPDLRGRLPMHWGHGPALSSYSIGRPTGYERVYITETEMPAHNHPMQASVDENSQVDAIGHVLGNFQPTPFYHDGSETDLINEFSPEAVRDSGNSESHTNLMPFLAVNFIICLKGTYPSRN